MIRAAHQVDRPKVEALLRAEKLPLDGVAEHFGSFFVVEDGERIVGAAGLEWYGDVALLRSVVVAPGERGTGLGALLTGRAIDEARGRRARALYLLTTTAADFFPRLGFQSIDRAELPSALVASRELQGACPASAIAMRLQLADGEERAKRLAEAHASVLEHHAETFKRLAK
jgi:amino-acid N-acetyltransferase